MVGFEVSINDLQFRGTLAALAAWEGSDLHDTLDVIGDAMVASTVMRFDEGHGPGGVAWKPSQRAIGTGGKTLIETGRLEQSITHNVNGNSVEWGTNVIYAAVHQFGATFTAQAREGEIFRKTDKAQTEIQPGFVKKSKSNFASKVSIPAHEVTIPARPFIGVDAEDETEILVALTERLQRYIVASASAFLQAAP